MKIKKNRILWFGASILMHGMVDGQTESSTQSSARPFGLDITASVMSAGSDEASSTFQTESLPVLLEFVNSNLNERNALSDIAAVSLDPEAMLLYTESSVRVYFLSEGAGYRNTLGYSTESIETGETGESSLIFPDASSYNIYYEDPETSSVYRNSSVPLVPGDFVDLGVYDEGTLIDFFLIANGANGGSSVYTADSTTNPDLLQHLVAFAVPESPYLLIGFEDLYGGGDKDYNDIVFVVDIGELNVAYLANPEPSTVMMMCLFGIFGVVSYRRKYLKKSVKERS